MVKYRVWLLVLLFGLLPVVSGDATDLVLERWLHRSKSVSPCENFYNHACITNDTFDIFEIGQGKLRNVTAAESLGNPTDSIILQYERLLDEAQVPDLEDVADTLRKFCNDEKRCFEKVLRRVMLHASTYRNEHSDEYQRSYIAALIQALEPKHLARHIALAVESVLDGAEFQAAIDYYVRQLILLKVGDNIIEAHWLGREETLESFYRVMNAVQSTVASRLQKTKWLQERRNVGFVFERIFMWHMENTKTNFIMATGAFNSVDKLKAELLVYDSQLNDNFDFYSKAFGNSARLAAVYMAHRDIYKPQVDSVLYNIKNVFQSYNGLNLYIKPVYQLFFGTAALLVLEGTPPAGLFGTFGFLYAHEFMHTYVHKEVFSEAKKCLVDYMANDICVANPMSLCDLKGAGWTFMEDGPDLEGSRTIYEAFLSSGIDPKARTYENLTVTNEEIFYFAMPLSYCKSPAWTIEDRDLEWEHNAYDVHSEPFIRFNAVLRQSEEFAAFFGCKKGDPMFLEPEKFCGFYGDKYVPTGAAATNSSHL